MHRFLNKPGKLIATTIFNLLVNWLFNLAISPISGRKFWFHSKLQDLVHRLSSSAFINKLFHTCCYSWLFVNFFPVKLLYIESVRYTKCHILVHLPIQSVDKWATVKKCLLLKRWLHGSTQSLHEGRIVWLVRLREKHGRQRTLVCCRLEKWWCHFSSWAVRERVKLVGQNLFLDHCNRAKILPSPVGFLQNRP